MNITYTSTMPDGLMSWLDDEARQSKSKKRTIIINALILYREHTKRSRLEETFRRAAKDNEMQDLAEQGLADFKNQLNNLEKWSRAIFT